MTSKTTRNDFLRTGAVLTAMVCLLLGSSVVRGEDADGGAAGDWLSMFAGARQVGLGGAMTAVADEPTGILWNPAGIGRLQQYQVQAGTVHLFEDTSVNSFSLCLPVSGRLSMGMTLLDLSSGEFEQTSELNESLGEFSEGEFAGMLTAALNLNPRWSLGANLKIVRQSIEEFDASGVGLDLGVIGQVAGPLRCGASLLNLGGPSLTLRETEESYPEELRLGVAVDLLGGRGLISTEIAHRDGPGTAARIGTEIQLVESIALRLGYYAGEPAGGFSYRLPTGWQFDYGVSDHELGLTHRFGFSYRFGGYHASAQAAPEIFSPTGQNPVTKFVLSARTKAEATEWRLVIRDKTDQVVRRFGGQGLPPAHVLWDGKGESGMPLPDGLYRYRLTVEDAEGHRLQSSEKVVEIYTGGTTGSVPVVVD